MTGQSECPRPDTADEVRNMILAHLAGISCYWADLPGLSPKDRCDGVVFSALVMLDWCSAVIPGIVLKLMPAEADRTDSEEMGQNWFERGMEIDDMLHEDFHRFSARPPTQAQSTRKSAGRATPRATRSTDTRSASDV